MKYEYETFSAHTLTNIHTQAETHALTNTHSHKRTHAFHVFIPCSSVRSLTMTS